jgi:hypothetical protein
MRSAAVVLWLCVLAIPAGAQEPQGRLSELVAEGITVFTPAELRRNLRLDQDAPLPESPDELAARLQRRYHREGYTKAVVTASYEEATGRLTLRADEGRIDAIAIEGIDDDLARELAGAFAIQPGSLFNTRQIARALNELLRPARGAIRPHYVTRANRESRDSPERSDASTVSAFDLVDRGGRRTLVVNLRRVNQDFDPRIGTDSREDWYSPVDGLNLALGFGGTIFDQRRFNHTTLQGYVSYKFARERVGYGFGIERPVFGGPETPRLLIHADVHDTTSSDDSWRISVTEQSLVALVFKNSFRDYYNERGYRIGAAFQPNGANELRAAWTADRHEPLANEADYSFFRDDEPFRSNRLASDGRLRAMVLGYTLDSRGLAEESGRATFRRHSAPEFFGSFGGNDPGVRLDWTSEVAREALGGDFDFTRHIGNVRVYVPFAPAQRLDVRLLFGTSTGTPPPQRLFGLGGIGTVHGYSFKEAIGERMVLANAEYHLGSYKHARVIGFLDVGRVYRPIESLNPTDEWLKGVGLGLAVGDLRVDFGWRADDVPDSLQVLVRFGPTF